MQHRIAGAVPASTSLGLVAWALYNLLDPRPGPQLGVVGLVLLLVFARAGFTWFRGRIVR